jgi:all-trans-retinol dehydrogenase (NAD+)
MAEMMFENPLDYTYSLLIDLIVFFVKSIYFLCEAIILTVLPDKFRKFKDVTDQVVLITGGAGGVGRHLALKFAKLNTKVVIWDINRDALQGTADALQREGYQCASYLVDISDKEQVYATANKVKQEIGKVDILINNAGIVTCRTFLELPDKAIEATYGVNILSHYWTAKAFLPEMIKDKRGHIVTVGSVTGLIGTYACTDYSATKFACIGFHESLFSELKMHGHDYVNLSLVCPSYIATTMFTGVKPRLMAMLEPDFVADSIRGIAAMKLLMPAKTFWELTKTVVRTPQSMMYFRGRGKSKSG